MGWTSYHASHYKRGTVDRKAECDAYFMEGLNEGHCKVEKSTMVGSVYYAAVRELVKCVGTKDGEDIYEPLPENEQEVWAAVFLTSVDMKDYHNFSYKDMSEDMGPAETDCPDSILNLLSPTDDEWALAWRERCRKRNASRRTLQKLPLGATIKVNGREHYVFTKRIFGYNKTPRWIDYDHRVYMRTKDILALGYTIIEPSSEGAV